MHVGSPLTRCLLVPHLVLLLGGRSRRDVCQRNCAGDSSNIAYLANVCVAEAARRCRVGETLIRHARQLARHWGNVSIDMFPRCMAAVCHGASLCFTAETAFECDRRACAGVNDLMVHIMVSLQAA